MIFIRGESDRLLFSAQMSMMWKLFLVVRIVSQRVPTVLCGIMRSKFTTRSKTIAAAATGESSSRPRNRSVKKV